MALKFILLFFIACQGVHCFTKDGNAKNKAKSVLVVGSTLPALLSSLLLVTNNVSVTIVYSSPEVDNQYAGRDYMVHDVAYRLPKMHPVITEQSTNARQFLNFMGDNFITVKTLNLFYQNGKTLTGSENEMVTAWLFKAVSKGCLSIMDVYGSTKMISAMEEYDYKSYRDLYSNITLADFAKLMEAKEGFVKCFIEPIVIGTGLSINTINAADALARTVFHYFEGSNGLRSYHLINNYTYVNHTTVLVDQIVRLLKSKNVTFIPNHQIKAFYVNPSTATITGDFDNPSKVYDFIILGDSLNESRRILQTTRDYNTGEPRIFGPLNTILKSLNVLKPNNEIMSWKIWLSGELDKDRPDQMHISDSPYPCSIQSIKQLHKLSGQSQTLTPIIEVIVAGTNGTRTFNWTKISNELVKFVPEIEGLMTIVAMDWVDLGVTMNVDYGAHRPAPSSLQSIGISNVVLASDWVEPIGETADDLERAFVVALQAYKQIN